MTNHLELYKCEICGNIVQVMHCADGELVCCGKPMQKIEPHSKNYLPNIKNYFKIFQNEILKKAINQKK